jgi:DNA-binding GntR family transcriptional regulator
LQRKRPGARRNGSDAIVRHQLHDQLVAEIREMIARGNFKPGEKIPEKQLCGHFQVSRTPLREALKVLAFEGFITLHPNRGARITVFTLKEIAESFPILGAVEALAGELACERVTDAEISHLKRLHDEMVGHFKRRELTAYFTVNKRIHDSILSAARNSQLRGVHRPLTDRIRCARLHGELAEDSWARAIREHEMMLEALEARDGPKLGGILRTHMANKFRYLETHFH